MLFLLYLIFFLSLYYTYRTIIFLFPKNSKAVLIFNKNMFVLYFPTFPIFSFFYFLAIRAIIISSSYFLICLAVLLPIINIAIVYQFYHMTSIGKHNYFLIPYHYFLFLQANKILGCLCLCSLF